MTDKERLAWMAERQAEALETIAKELAKIRAALVRQPVPVPLQNWPIDKLHNITFTCDEDPKPREERGM